MYSYHDLGAGRQMFVAYVPPGLNPRLAGSPLADISGIHVDARMHPEVSTYAEAVQAASVDELELARPQMFFVLRDVADRVRDHGFEAERAMGGTQGPAEFLSTMLEGVSGDFEKLLVAADRNPRSGAALRRLESVHAYLAEVAALAKLGAEHVDAELEEVADRAARVLLSAGERVDAFVAEVGPRYPLVAGTLTPSAAVAEAARQRLSSAAYRPPRITPRNIERAIGACGEWDTLWAVSAGGARREAAIGKGMYRPYDRDSAEDARSAVAAVLRAYEDAFGGLGVVADLRAAATALRHGGMASVAWSNEHTEGHIRNERKGLYVSQEEHDARIRRQIEDLPSDRLGTLVRAHSALAAANTLSAFLNVLDRALHPERPESAFLHFEARDGAIVGVPDIAGMDALVIYDDTVLQAEGRHATAVYAVRMDRDAALAGPPSLEEIRESHFRRATNYHSLEECLAEVDGGGIELAYFFDGVEVWGHDAFAATETLRAVRAARTPGVRERDRDALDGADEPVIRKRR